jgi:hypothetical protein
MSGFQPSLPRTAISVASAAAFIPSRLARTQESGFGPEVA